MKLIILRNNLLEALNNLERAIGDNVNLPILKSVLFQANENKITISATNLELAIRVVVPGKITEHGEVAVLFSLINNVAKNLTVERVIIEEKEGNILLTTDNYEAVIQTQNPKEFPIIPSITNKIPLQITIDDFKDALHSVIVATQYSEVRPEISGVFLSYKNENLSFVATDSFRLSERILQKELVGGQEGEIEIILPLKIATELLRVLKEEEKEVQIFVDPNQVLFKTSTQEIISHLIDGKFPDYKAIVPKGTQIEVDTNREEFLGAVRLTSAFSSRINDITIRTGDNKKFLEIYSATSSLGENRYRIPAKIKGDSFSIVFNWRYLLDGLKVFKTENIILGVNAPDKPVVLKSDKEHFLTYVLMPIRS